MADLELRVPTLASSNVEGQLLSGDTTSIKQVSGVSMLLPEKESPGSGKDLSLRDVAIMPPPSIKDYKDLALHILRTADWISMREVRDKFPFMDMSKCRFYDMQPQLGKVVDMDNACYVDFLKYLAEIALEGSDGLKKEDVRLKCIVLDNFSIWVNCFSEVCPLLESLCSAFKVVAIPAAVNFSNIIVGKNIWSIKSLTSYERKLYYEFIFRMYPKLFYKKAFELYPDVKKLWGNIRNSYSNDSCFILKLEGMSFSPIHTAIDWVKAYQETLKDWAVIVAEYAPEDFHYGTPLLGSLDGICRSIKNLILQEPDIVPPKSTVGMHDCTEYILRKAEWITMTQLQQMVFPPEEDKNTDFFGRPIDLAGRKRSNYTDLLRFLCHLGLGKMGRISKDDIRLKCVVLDDFSIEVTCFSLVRPLLEDLCTAFKVITIPKALNLNNISIKPYGMGMSRGLSVDECQQWYQFISDMRSQLFCEEAFQVSLGVKQFWKDIWSSYSGGRFLNLNLAGRRFSSDKAAVDWVKAYQEKLDGWADVVVSYVPRRFECENAAIVNSESFPIEGDALLRPEAFIMPPKFITGHKDLAIHILSSIEQISMNEVRDKFHLAHKGNYGFYEVPPQLGHSISMDNFSYADFLEYMTHVALEGIEVLSQEEIRLKCILLDDFSITVGCFSKIQDLLEKLCRAFKIVAIPAALDFKNIRIKETDSVCSRELKPDERKQYFDLIFNMYPKFFCNEALEQYPDVKKVWARASEQFSEDRLFDFDLKGIRFEGGMDADCYVNECTKKLNKWAHLRPTFYLQNF